MIRRRDLLAFGLAWPIGTYGGWVFSPPGVGGEPGEAAVALGYLGPAGRLIAADRLVTGDRSFLRRGAQVTIEGFARRSEPWSGERLRALDLAALFSVESGAETRDVPYWVWHERSRRVATSSSSVRFFAPVDPEYGLRFLVGLGEPGSQREVRLVAGAESGAPKLRRGSYVLAVAGPAGSPGWTDVDHENRPEEGLPPRLSRPGWLGEREVDFDAVLLSIDYGPARA